MAHSFVHLLVHIVFSTKDRRPCMDGDLPTRLFPYVGGIVRELDGHALAIGGMPDHIHLLVSLPQTRAVADVLRVVKANSSRWVHETWAERRDFAWQTGYGAFSVSQSNRETVQRYIEHQAEHHRKLSFQEEFRALLRKHGLEYDEHYAWD
jgi:REP element-mobilizing transposase RayT